MKERPIIFHGEMVQAILDGRKTMTRRVIKSPKWSDPSRDGVDYGCPYGQSGDRLWVRETFKLDSHNDCIVIYKADGKIIQYNRETHISQYWYDAWKPSIFMPRWASRITLEIVNVRVERLQEINNEDIGKEGWPASDYGDWGAWFVNLWDSINKEYPWASNPWVWVIEFRQIKG